MTRGNPMDELADWKFQYDLLANELFHLYEFTSLIEFDPVFRHESDSFKMFLAEKKLDLQFSDEDVGNIEESNAVRRIRRRQKRSRGSEVGDERLKDIQYHVDEKYRELGLELQAEKAVVPRVNSNSKPDLKRRKRPEPVTRVKKEMKKRREGLSGKNVKQGQTKAENVIDLGGTGEGLAGNNDSDHRQIHGEEEKEKEQEAENALIEFSSPLNDIIMSYSQSPPPEECVYDDDYDSFYFTTSSEEDEPVTRRSTSSKKKSNLPNIKFIVNPPKQTVTNPLHVSKPEFSSLHDFLLSYKSLDDDVSIDEFNEYVAEQRKVVSGIQKGLKNGALKYDPETDSIQAIGFKDVQNPQNNKPEPVSLLYKEQEKQTLQNHLINHGLVMSKAFQERRRLRMARARKISLMIEQHFKHVAGAEERKAKEEEKKKRALARAAVQAVKKRWTMAERAYKVLKKDEEEQLKRIKGKEHLTKMLEQSTQLLGAQLNQPYIDGDESDSSNAYSSEQSFDSDEVTSTSESESEADYHEGKAEADSKLTVEELRSKYSGLDDLKVNKSNVDKEVSQASYSGGNIQQNNVVPTNQPEKILLSESENLELMKTMKEDGYDMLDESNSDSTSMTGESSTGSSGFSTNEEGYRSDNSEPSGLASLFGNINEQNVSDEEVNYSSDEDISKDSENKDKLINGKEVSPTAKLQDINVLKTPDDALSVVDVPLPSLLRGILRTYQKQGLNWLASLYNNNTNGILADEMGLGKTIQTIALLAYLACDKENWGPHLIIVPTSVLLNWEMEFKRFAPGFKVLTYYGSPQQRKEKRKGWNKPDRFHVCITSYQLVVHDQHSFKRKRWQYMILDEAHNIKNFRSTRWQALLNFNTRRRLLLTGTPLQNNIAELWSLLYFLMPQTALENGSISGFADLDAFQQWFGRPVDKLLAAGVSEENDEETKKTVAKLHQVLRPYLLRRLKADVEKQMPAKYEHIVYCRLSKRQRFLYDDFMSRAQTKATLSSGNFMSIINCLMQLRKVCNHPDLFEVRPILTSFCIEKCVASNYAHLNQTVLRYLHDNDFETNVNLENLNLVFTNNDFNMTTQYSENTSKLQCDLQFVEVIQKLREDTVLISQDEPDHLNFQDINEFYKGFTIQKSVKIINHYLHMQYLNSLRCGRRPMYGQNLIKLLSIDPPTTMGHSFLNDIIKPLETRLITNRDVISEFAIVTPKVVTLDSKEVALGLNSESVVHPTAKLKLTHELQYVDNPFDFLQTKLSIAFPDKSLLQYDCGKLQNLALLLQKLKDNGHRALIFTQMTKVLDILEQFLNYHGYLYMRLDGATKIEDRQILTERFNSDSKITVFILSSRSGGLGINLTGADTVIFYDSDWNPAMDKQCQDRCHRIGQTRDVHIYRFVSEHTIESNILKKANQKRELDNIVIQKGDFTTDYFSKLSVNDLLGAEAVDDLDNEGSLLLADTATGDSRKFEKMLAQAEDEDDVKAAKLAMQEAGVDDIDFRESTVIASGSQEDDNDNDNDEEIVDGYGGTRHVEEYMIRFIANGYLYD